MFSHPNTPNVMATHPNPPLTKDYLHILSHHNHHTIHLPTLKALSSSNNYNNYNTTNITMNNFSSDHHASFIRQQQQQRSNTHIAHESLPNSLTEMIRSQQQLQLNPTMIKILCMIPTRQDTFHHQQFGQYAIATCINQPDPNQLFIVDLINNGQLIQTFNLEQVQRDQKFFHCSDFGTIKLSANESTTNWTPFSYQHNNNNNHQYSDVSSQYQFVMHGTMFCYYRKSDGQLFGGTLEAVSNNKSCLHYLSPPSSSPMIKFSMNVLFRMTIPRFSEDNIVCMFPDASSQTALIAVRKLNAPFDSTVYCLYLRPMNDVYINIRYELINVAPTTNDGRLLLNRNGETICYMKNDHDTICVLKVGHYVATSASQQMSNGTQQNCIVEYQLKKVLEKGRMMRYSFMSSIDASSPSNSIPTSDLIEMFMYHNNISSSKSKKRMKMSCDQTGQLTTTSRNNMLQCSSQNMVDISPTQQYQHDNHNSRTISLVQNNGTIYCIQLVDSPTTSMIRIVNMSTSQMLEIPQIDPQQQTQHQLFPQQQPQILQSQQDQQQTFNKEVFMVQNMNNVQRQYFLGSDENKDIFASPSMMLNNVNFSTNSMMGMVTRSSPKKLNRFRSNKLMSSHSSSLNQRLGTRKRKRRLHSEFFSDGDFD